MSALVTGPGQGRVNSSSAEQVVRIEADLARKAARVRLYRQQTMAEYLSPILRDQIEADYREVLVAEYQQEFSPKRPK